jgi:fumarate reductase subunit D
MPLKSKTGSKSSAGRTDEVRKERALEQIVTSRLTCSEHARRADATAREIREQIDHAFPRILRPYLTWQSGVPFTDEVLTPRSQLYRLLQGTSIFVFGIACGIGALPMLGPWGALLLPVTCSVAVGGSRYLQLGPYHHAAHENLISKYVSSWAGRAIAIVLIIQPFDRYKPRHRIEHHGPHTVSTDRDPTVTFLVSIGIEPGVPTPELKRRFFLGVGLTPRPSANAARPNQRTVCFRNVG